MMSIELSSSQGSVLPPAYGTASLADVLPAAAAAIGATDVFPQSHLTFPTADNYVIFLVDGLGYDLLEAHRDEAPFLASLLTQPGTAAVPSTTATSLTSLGTALVPGQHGIIGFTSRIPGTDQLLNALLWDDAIDPHEWQPHPTAFEQLQAAGFRVTSVNLREFADSGLTNVGYRGATYVGANKLGERIAGVVKAAATSPSLTYVYEGDLDWMGHRYGVDSPQWRAQLIAVDQQAQMMREALPETTRLVIVADHGMVDSPASSRLDIDQYPHLRDGVGLIGGEARFRQLYCHGGTVERVIDTWQDLLGERALVVSKEDAIRRGWFGAVTATVSPRIGDVLVAALGDFALMSSVDFPFESSLIGFHGSLTPVEMRIPIIVS